jgi:small GTP-binding protein
VDARVRGRRRGRARGAGWLTAVQVRPDHRYVPPAVRPPAAPPTRRPEDSYSISRTVDGAPFRLALTDTAGQEEYRGLWAASNLRADAFLLVYDITAPASLHQQLPHFLDLIRMEQDRREDAGLAPPVTFVAGNKCDLHEERAVSSHEGLEWARTRGCGFMETSAREHVNVEETFARKRRRPRATPIVR